MNRRWWRHLLLYYNWFFDSNPFFRCCHFHRMNIIDNSRCFLLLQERSFPTNRDMFWTIRYLFNSFILFTDLESAEKLNRNPFCVSSFLYTNPINIVYLVKNDI